MSSEVDLYHTVCCFHCASCHCFSGEPEPECSRNGTSTQKCGQFCVLLKMQDRR